MNVIRIDGLAYLLRRNPSPVPLKGPDLRPGMEGDTAALVDLDM